MIRLIWKATWLVPAALALTVVTASAQNVRLTATLTGGQEAPNKVNTGAVGTADVGVDVTNQEITVSEKIWNLPTGTVGAHIHVGAADTAGPVIFDFSPPLGATGDFSLILRLSAANLIPRPNQGILTMEDALQALVNGNCYVNVHSSANPGGEIRGQLNVVPLR